LNRFTPSSGGGTRDGFIDALFHDVLSRPADPGALAAFKTLPSAQIVEAVFGSHEYRNDLVGGWYQQFLDRPADGGGLTTFTDQLASGATDQQVIAKLIASQEYFQRIAR